LVTPYGDKEIAEEPVFYEEMLFYAHSDHPYLKQPEIKINHIITDDIWLLNDGHCFRSQVINLCAIDKNHKNNLPFELEGGSLDTLLRIINREGGFTIIPELAAIDLMEHGSKNIRHFSDKNPLREVSVCYSKHYSKRRLVDVLINEIKESIPSEMLNKTRGETVLWR
jgi:LysR substrate binding domain.